MNRPVNLSILTMKFPVTAIVSILHRVSGVVLFLFIPALLYVLSCSLRSASDFAHIHALFSGPVTKLLLWAFLAALLYHMLAGIRHLLMDVGFGETLKSAKITSMLVFLLFGLGLILSGVWLWA